MSLSPAKYKILESMLLNERPTKATQIAKECGNDFKPVMMHLIWLTRNGYTASPTKGLYTISQKGKEALGVWETSKECAKQLLTKASNEDAFHFYIGMDKPLNLFACGFKDFLEKIQAVDSTSLEFHVNRGDFENWFISLGDAEIAKKMTLLKATGIRGDPLRAKLKEIVENRITELSALV